MPPSVPHFTLVMSYAEFALVQQAARSATARFSGDAELRVDLGHSGDEVTWNVTINDAKFMELLDGALTERVSGISGAADSIEAARNAPVIDRATALSTRDRVHEALLAPSYELTTIEGTLRHDHGQWAVRSVDCDVPLSAGTVLSLADALVGHEVVASGVVRKAGILDAIRLVEKRPNTLDLFVMSLCPFARRAEASILPRLSVTAGGQPEVRVHYIFYAAKPDSREGFTCMHGEPEVRENLVQMLLRDEHPGQFPAYLQLRALSDEPWEVLAARAGLDATSLLRIAHRIASDRDELIAREYTYVALQCGVRDGSPTIAWEGRNIDRISEVPMLAGLATTVDRCGETP